VINLRKYGQAPFNVAVIHGGPGAPGEMAPVARELSPHFGVLEPIQTAASLEGQLQELYAVLDRNGDLPLTLIGWSWGAWLSFIFSAHYPLMVKKLIIVGSGPFEEKYATNIMKTRLSRLTEKERAEVQSIMRTFNDPSIKDKNSLFHRFGKLLTKADTYDPLTLDTDVLETQFDIHQSVWKEAVEFRKNGELLRLGEKIQCPVVAIHGNHDPHPHEGVKIPLSLILREFRFILLRNCGHHPWLERDARSRFYDILRKELHFNKYTKEQ